MLEDDFTYVLRKALKGHSLSPSEVAALAGLPEREVLAFSRGSFSASTALQLAPTLGLNPQALASHTTYLPKPLTLTQVHRLEMPFEQERVNAWLITLGEISLLFDTGYLPGSCLHALRSLTLPTLQQIFITHAHVDHVGGIPDFIALGHTPSAASIPHTHPIHPGPVFQAGSISIEACDLSGHATPSLGYLITGPPQPILITGDALFAGSMGGCANPTLYRHALSRLRHVLTPLPDHTVLLPGHGPATTLGEERIHNPFL